MFLCIVIFLYAVKSLKNVRSKESMLIARIIFISTRFPTILFLSLISIFVFLFLSVLRMARERNGFDFPIESHCLMEDGYRK